MQLKGLTPSGHLPVGLLSGGKQGIESGKNFSYFIWRNPSKAKRMYIIFDTKRNSCFTFSLYM